MDVSEWMGLSILIGIAICFLTMVNKYAGDRMYKPFRFLLIGAKWSFIFLCPGSLIVVGCIEIVKRISENA